MLILFLDFDGVLHPADATPDQFFCYLPALEDTLRPFDEVELVLSTLWREERSLDALIEHFAPDIRPRILGATPQLPACELERGHRQREIEAWLAMHRPGGDWLALDDRQENFDADCPHLLWVPRAGSLAPGLNPQLLSALALRLAEHSRTAGRCGLVYTAS